MNNKKLRRGFTTGSCAAGASKAAAIGLLTGKIPETVVLETPSGVLLHLKTEQPEYGEGVASCAVRKDSGDDPDVTNRIFIYASVSFQNEEDILIDGGEGIGRVTKPGLACPVGSAAINPIPRQMTMQAVRQVCLERGYQGGCKVVISAPEGKEIAQRTFNPRLGIEGGISILGTSGIVEPMSHQALKDTIRAEMNVLRASGYSIVAVAPGNYGEEFAQETLGLRQVVTCSNFIGDAIDFAAELDFDGMLMIGHLGKLVKLAVGMMNTHSQYGDGRMEILAAHGALAGAGKDTIRAVMEAATTDQAVDLLDHAGVLEPVMESLIKKIQDHILRRAGEKLRIGAIIFQKNRGLLGKTADADWLLDQYLVDMEGR